MTDVLFDVQHDSPRDEDLERRVQLVIAECRRQPGWTVDEAKDRALALDLIRMYPRMNLPEQITAWRAWMSEFEPKPGKGVKLRARVLRWCSNAREYAGRRPASGRGAGAAVRRKGSTAPKPAAAFEQFGGNGIRTW